jgi:enoyl-CoA hydratase/carnithine racemase
MRNRSITIVTATLLTLFVASSALAGEIYKWTDAEGNVHYGDVPVDAQSERLAIKSKPTNSSRVQATTQARLDASAKQREEAAKQPAGPTPEELRAEADERAKQCTAHRAQLQKFLTSRRIYRMDDDGERVYMDEAEMQATRERAENQVEEYCN